MISTLKKYLQLLLIVLLLLALPVNAKEDKNLVNIYFFHSKDCIHCNEEIKLLDSIEKKYDNVKIYRYEIHDKENNKKRQEVINLYDLRSNGVPITIIGDTPYIGYSENTSNKKYIKTIEYYSRYGYEDKVGTLFNIDKLPTYELDNNNKSLKEFIKEYGNYKLIGNIYTDKLDSSSNAIILGVLSQINIVNISLIIIVVLLLEKIKKTKEKTLLLTTYFIILFILNTIHIIPNNIYKIIILVLSLITFIYTLIKGIKTNDQKYFIFSLFNVIAILNIYLKEYFYSTNLEAFITLININNLEGLNLFGYYANYLFIVLIINISFILIYSSIQNRKGGLVYERFAPKNKRV